MKYNLSKLMKKAWSLYRQAMKKGSTTFSEALKTAWRWIRVQDANAVKVETAANEACYGDIVCHTWAGWQALGRMVCHTETALFKVTIDDPTTRTGTRIQSYFSREQTQPTPVA